MATSALTTTDQKTAKTPALIALVALVVALLVLPAISSIWGIEQGGLADALFVLQAVLVLVGFIGLAMAVARTVRNRRKG